MFYIPSFGIPTNKFKFLYVKTSGGIFTITISIFNTNPQIRNGNRWDEMAGSDDKGGVPMFAG